MKTIVVIIERVFSLQLYEIKLQKSIICFCDKKLNNYTFIIQNSSVSYEKTLIIMFESNIFLEQIAIEDYNKVIDKTDNANLILIFRNDIMDIQN